MSLDVSPDLLAAAQRGEVDDDAFVACVRESLPYAWDVVSSVAGAAPVPGSPTVHEVPPPSEAARGELLRALASDAIRGGLERHFGVVLAFQNCHRVAAFSPAGIEGADADTFDAFVSPRGQLLNQSPELRDC
ncbi:SCO5389 family protein [Actinomycetospora sp. TBRC 11914]|uniref:SCO5389 family protein n=1 Tax=Actinomycetospora sp. TBRC 11914 TaxID=2729387 RepID=UPI00145EFE97|nr:SCO5389 family protein [Actinomycetospora sp. TBRC 11914]NMO89232.1 hypothetical protein [Actinomycetospora sp. TBRC 11914]